MEWLLKFSEFIELSKKNATALDDLKVDSKISNPSNGMAISKTSSANFFAKKDKSTVLSERRRTQPPVIQPLQSAAKTTQLAFTMSGRNKETILPASLSKIKSEIKAPTAELKRPKFLSSSISLKNSLSASNKQSDADSSFTSDIKFLSSSQTSTPISYLKHRKTHSNDLQHNRTSPVFIKRSQYSLLRKRKLSVVKPKIVAPETSLSNVKTMRRKRSGSSNERKPSGHSVVGSTKSKQVKVVTTGEKVSLVRKEVVDSKSTLSEGDHEKLARENQSASRRLVILQSKYDLVQQMLDTKCKLVKQAMHVANSKIANSGASRPKVERKRSKTALKTAKSTYKIVRNTPARSRIGSKSVRRSVSSSDGLTADSRKHLSGRRVHQYICLKGQLYRKQGKSLTLVGPIKSNNTKLNRQRDGSRLSTSGGRRSYSLLRSHSQIVARNVLSRSLATAVQNKYRLKGSSGKDGDESATHCIYFNRFGKCNRGTSCKFVHDPKKVAICSRFLRGRCITDNCTFSHNIAAEKMPVCSFFIRGCCTKDNCPYLHVNVGVKAEVCPSFLAGYCKLGLQCKKKHSSICQEFQMKGSCSNQPNCKLRHTKKAKQRRQSYMDMDHSRADNSNSKRNESDTDSAVERRRVVLTATQLPSYISVEHGTPSQNNDTPLQSCMKPVKIRPMFTE